MTRALLLALLNMALPFLVRAGWILLLRYLYRQHMKKNPQLIDVTPKPEWYFPVVKLLLIGVALMAVTFIGARLFTPPDHWHAANPAQDKNY